ncbi:MAG: radical SAM protein, partial [Candidatus Omnitrophica bacterium]|nr:radical SAM protein [Candidatus Omnitrophota bacterium]
MDKLEIPKVRFTWIMHYACNYRCPYCFYYEGSGWEILGARNVYISPDEWLVHWRRIYQMYGRSYIVLTGGEPFIYPHFTELISRISEMHFPIDITTNSSGDLDSFVKAVSPERISLSLSFHPHFDNINVFAERVEFLRKNNFTVVIGFTAYPLLLKNFKYYMKILGSTGAEIEINFFRGIYKGIAYPAGYTEEEKA